MKNFVMMCGGIGAVQESGNTDTSLSVQMLKKRDREAFGFGPVWDFDPAFEKDWRTDTPSMKK
jgi:hypothetical protein